MKTKLFFSCILFIVSVLNLSAQQPAFPGAEGAGKYVTGGRGTAKTPTTIFEVTSLDDTNVPGTLRYACSATATYRTIVFRVSGTIHLTSQLRIPGNTTIAGQTAPGDGICLADYWVTLNANNIIIRYIRFRLGDRHQLIINKDAPAGCSPVFKEDFDIAKKCYPQPNVSGSYDALGASYKKNFMIDHCSVSWSNDEALSLKECDSSTVQWTIVSEPLDYSYHFETIDGTANTAPEGDFQHHGYGGIFGGFHATFHHNIYAHCKSRTPRFGASGPDKTRVDFRNNVIYNWGINNVYGGEGGEFNVVNNFYKSGPNTTKHCQFVDTDPTAKYFVNGNKMDDPTCGNIAQNNIGLTAPILPQVTPYTHSADSAYILVLAKAGASLKRDAVDAKIINEIKTRTGKFIDVQGGYPHGTPYSTSQSAWPTLTSLTAPIDTDKDGMPDDWEISNGLNSTVKDHMNDKDNDGYTNIEEYLNCIVAGNCYGTVVSPTVDITSPITNTQVCSGQAVTINATASITTGSISKVDFYDGTVLIGTDNASPYSIAYTPTTIGTHTITAQATSLAKTVTTSSAVAITSIGIPTPPIVISPVNYAQYAPTQALKATGTGLVWYTVATGGQGSTNAPFPSSATIGTINYYVAQAINTCESSRSKISVIIDNKSTTSNTLEAEDALYYKSIEEKTHLGFSGTAYVNTDNVIDCYIEWTVNISKADSFDLAFNYSNGTTLDRSGVLNVGSKIISNTMPFPNSGSWDIWQLNKATTVYLGAGINKIKLTATTINGLANIDYLSLVNNTNIITNTNDINSTQSIIESIYPNPTTSNATLLFNLPEATLLNICIVDILGRPIKQLANEEFPSGKNSIHINTSNMSSGCYYVRLLINNSTITKPIFIK